MRSELLDFPLLEDAEGLGWVVGAVDVGWVEDVAQLVAAEPVLASEEAIQLGAEPGAPVRRSAQATRHDVLEVAFAERRRRKNRKLLEYNVFEMCPADLLPGHKIEHQGYEAGCKACRLPRRHLNRVFQKKRVAGSHLREHAVTVRSLVAFVMSRQPLSQRGCLRMWPLSSRRSQASRIFPIRIIKQPQSDRGARASCFCQAAIHSKASRS